MKQSNSSTLARGLFWIFAALVVVVNAAVTFQFGAVYLRGAFGIQDALTALLAGALYAVLFLDMAALVWLLVYMRAAETTQQRTIALVAAVLSFAGSLVATAYMLATGTDGVLTTHARAVSSAAQLFMIVAVVLHAVAAVLFKLASRSETVQQASIDASTSAVAEAVTEAKKQVQQQVPELARAMSAEMRSVILAQLGFVESADGRLHYVPDATQEELDTRRRRAPLPAPTEQRAALAASSSPAPAAVQSGDVQERFHTVFSDVHGDVPISTNLTRAEFNAVIAAAERAKSESGAQYDVSDLNAMARQLYEATQQEAPQRPTNGRSAGQ